MGIYIEGAVMPMEGNETIIRIQSDGSILDQYGHHLYLKAVSVPPHGDLVERNALLRVMPWEEMVSRFAVSYAPTIIPASEEE